MRRCPITYETVVGEKYSRNGLKLLSPRLHSLNDFLFTAKEQIELAVLYAAKLSIQGVQPKLSVKLNVAQACFEITEKGGNYIFKPPHQIFRELPQNEDVTMRLARLVGIEVPVHGMIYTADGSLTYFIKRFDRLVKGKKLAVEDFSQLLGYFRETKYESSMEKLITVLDKHCTFPLVEKVKFFRLALFNFLVGNEDMHLKNFSLIRRGEKVMLSPAYDLLNTSIVMNAKEEIALSLRGKKSNLKREDFIKYLGGQRLGLPHGVISDVLARFTSVYKQSLELIQVSFLSEELKQKYLALLQERWERLGLHSAQTT